MRRDGRRGQLAGRDARRARAQSHRARGARAAAARGAERPAPSAPGGGGRRGRALGDADTLRRIVAELGVGGLWRGLGPTMGRTRSAWAATSPPTRPRRCSRPRRPARPRRRRRCRTPCSPASSPASRSGRSRCRSTRCSAHQHASPPPRGRDARGGGRRAHGGARSTEGGAAASSRPTPWRRGALIAARPSPSAAARRARRSPPRRTTPRSGSSTRRLVTRHRRVAFAASALLAVDDTPARPRVAGRACLEMAHGRAPPGGPDQRQRRAAPRNRGSRGRPRHASGVPSNSHRATASAAIA